MRNLWLGALALFLVLSGLNLAPWSDVAGEQSKISNAMGTPHPLAGIRDAHWLLDEGSGQYANDTSGNNNNGTLLPSYPGNAPAWTSGGISGNALMFDGVDDYVETPNIGFSGNVPLSIAFWAKVNVIVITNNFVSVGYRSELNLIGRQLLPPPATFS
jgi:hypothetical protein